MSGVSGGRRGGAGQRALGGHDSGGAARPEAGRGAGGAPPAGAGAGRTPADRRADGPRRVRGGVRLRARDGVVTREGAAGPWVERVEEAIPPDELGEGLRYARLGQTVAVEVAPGEVRASVQGSQARPYETRIAVGAFSAEQWDAIIEAMAGEAVYLVKLLAGQLPDGIDELLAPLGLALAPPRGAHVRLACTCPRGGACRHAAALGYVFAEQLAAEPLLLMQLRGMAPASLLERLRQARVMQARGAVAAHVDPVIPEAKEEPPPLESHVDDFWRPGPQLAKAREAPPSHHVNHALLRRLGPSPLEGRFPLVGLLASIYDTVAGRAVRLRDQAEHLEVGVAEDCDADFQCEEGE